MNEIDIRPAKINEISAVQRMTELAYKVPYKEACITTRPHEPADIKGKIKRGEMFIFVAVLNLDIVGAIRCEIHGKDRVQFSHLAVLENYRRQGIGSKLVGAVENLGKRKKVKSAMLDCLREKKLDGFYKKLGYKIDYIKICGGFHEIFMSKSLLL